jgi:hypothetical protein
MPGVGEIILKPKIFVTFEQQSKMPGWHNNQKFKAAPDILRDPQINDDQALDLLCDTPGSAGEMSSAVRTHFKNHWLGRHPDPAKHYWPQVPTAKLIRAGMRHVCETFDTVAKSTGQKPCEYFWVSGRSLGSTGWEILVAEGDVQITVLFVTPQPSYSEPALTKQPNPKIRKISLDQAGNAVVAPTQEPT